MVAGWLVYGESDLDMGIFVSYTCDFITIVEMRSCDGFYCICRIWR